MSSSPLIPRDILFGNADHMMVRISPDGQWITYLAPVEGVMNLWVAEIEALEKARPVTFDQKRGIQTYSWTYADQTLIYLQDREGDENWEIYRLDLRTQEVLNLTPFKGINARILKLSEQFPEEIIVSYNKRRPEFHDLYRIHLKTGETKLLFENNLYAGFNIDHNFVLRFGVQATPEGGTLISDLTDPVTLKPFMSFPPEDALHSGILGFDRSNTVLYMTDSRQRDKVALYEYDLKTQEQRLIGEDTLADVADVLIHPNTKVIEGYAAAYERKRWHFLDPIIAEDMAYLGEVETGDMEILSRAHEDQKWIVGYLMDDRAVQYYLYDRHSRKAQFLFSGQASLDEYPLVKMHPRVITARDGLKLVSYLSLPKEVDPSGSGYSSKPLPLVLLVHGGPHARDSWGYNSLHQWLANRGYAVLSVNYRGSVGFGKEFTAAGNGQWAAKMHEDLIDAVNWAVEAKIADPDKVAIMGGSYGGYAALVGLTFTPDVFACAVDIVGVSNLLTLVQSIPPYWKPLLDLMRVMVGADPETPEGQEFLKSRSPITYVDRIKKPLLIGHGANDSRVKQAESDQIVQAMEKKGIPVTYVLYPDEGHGFLRPENRQSFYGITESFLSKILGGRSESVASFKGSSLQIKAGLEYVPEIKEAFEKK